MDWPHRWNWWGRWGRSFGWERSGWWGFSGAGEGGRGAARRAGDEHEHADEQQDADAGEGGADREGQAEGIAAVWRSAQHHLVESSGGGAGVRPGLPIYADGGCPPVIAAIAVIGWRFLSAVGRSCCAEVAGS